MPDPERRRRVQALLPDPADIIRLRPAILHRADELVGLGFKAADAVHVAAAERLRADVLLTCDDRFRRIGRRMKSKLAVRIADPVIWLREVSDAPNT